MNTWLIILLVILVILYIAVRIMKPQPVRMSRFELDRRAEEGDERARQARERLRASPFLWGVWWFVSAGLLIGIVTLLAGLAGGWAFLLGVIMVIAVAWLERWPLLRSAGKRLFERNEARLMKLYGARRYLVFIPLNKPRRERKIDSEAELLHLLDGVTFLEPERRKLIHSALEFTGLSVSDAMSGRRSIRSVEKGEVLGPLVVDELYKTGKTAFVVTDGNIDIVIGILKLDRLTSLDLQESPAALKAMEPDVHYIDESAPITDALSYLRSSKAPFLVVQDGEQRTVGLLSMDNILRCLFES